MRVRAKMTFIGEDGSMGFKKGKEYTAEVFYHCPYLWVKAKKLVFSTECPYGSPESLRKNWLIQDPADIRKINLIWRLENERR